MQPVSRGNPSFFCAILVVVASGCPAPKPSVTVEPTPAARPWAGVAVTVRSPDAAMTAALTPVAKRWATRTGATVTWSADAAAADIAIVRAPSFGSGCAAGEFLTLPPAVRDPRHPFQLNGQIDAYYEGLAGWQGQPFGVVLGADAAVLLYRKDRFDDPTVRSRFRTRTSRDLQPPSSWDDITEVAGFFAGLDAKPSLPALPSDTVRRLDLFHRVAATTDRPAITTANPYGRSMNDLAPEAFSFHFDYATGNPRLTSPGFALALETIVAWAPSAAKAGDGDPVAALEADAAVMAIATLGDLHRLSQKHGGTVPPRYGLVRVPGSRRFYDSLTGKVETVRGSEPNVVPYLSASWVGGVTAKSSHADAAFDLLGELGSPAGAGAIVATSAIGSGPWRADLLDTNKRTLWYGYGLAPEPTAALATALRPFVAGDLRNPAVAPRGPGIEAMMAILASHVQSALDGTAAPAKAMADAQRDWLAHDAKLGPPAQVKAWRRSDLRGK
jgi:hypothetical protein